MADKSADSELNMYLINEIWDGYEQNFICKDNGQILNFEIFEYLSVKNDLVKCDILAFYYVNNEICV